jgi:glycosyltransferase involved in cell wall biosynthesis
LDVKVILISHLPLPYHSIGSWTTLYHNYIRKNKHQIDAIICPPIEIERKKYSKIEYHFSSKPWYFKYKQRFLSNRFYPIINELNKFINKNNQNKILIQIIDNFGLFQYVDLYLRKNKIRDNIYIQYTFHGFSINENLMNKMSISCDEIIFLTNLAYKYNLKHQKLLPKNISVLNNGIDTQNFSLKLDLRSKEITTFLWCSQDRPKKGLHIILEIWPEFHKRFPHTELKIVGTHKTYKGQGITSLGRIPNRKLPALYQVSHVYLFPTLCHEGFGLTLAEALHCGCFCIASKIGGVPEVLKNGKYGWLIKEPHNPKQWYSAMDKYMIEKPNHIKIPADLYSQESWAKGMNEIITKAKYRLLNN